MRTGAALQSYIDEEPEILFQFSRDLLYSILPLIGTWVGTVIAFYFSRDNFEAASKNVRDVLRDVSQERLAKTKAQDVMIPLSQITTFEVDPEEDSATSISETVIPFMNEHSISRLIIFDRSGRCRGVMHESIIYRFLSAAYQHAAPEVAPPPISKFSFEDVLTGNFNAELSNEDVIKRTTGFVDGSISLAEVKDLMDQITSDVGITCRDVMVTKGGVRGGAVAGWINEALIEKHSRVN